MAAPITVYIVTSGYHEDYTIVAVFSTRELAERCVRHDDERVEEYRLDDPDFLGEAPPA